MMYSTADASNEGGVAQVTSQAWNEASQFEATQLEAFDTQTQNDADSQGLPLTVSGGSPPMEVAVPRTFMTLIPLNRNKANQELMTKLDEGGNVITQEDGRFNVHKVGRNAICDIILQGGRVSNTHVEIYCQKNVVNEQSEVWLLPKGQNGTWVNDTEFPLHKEQPRKLNTGDTLYLVNPRPVRRGGNRSGSSSASLDERMVQEIDDNAFRVLINNNMRTRIRSSTHAPNMDSHMSLFQHVTNGTNARNHKNTHTNTTLQEGYTSIPGVGEGQENQYGGANNHQNVQHPNNRGVRFHDDCHNDKRQGSNRPRNNNSNNNNSSSNNQNNSSSSNVRRNDSDQELLDILRRRRDIYDFYEITRVLGAGAYATVKLGINKLNGKHYAVKIIDTRSTAITPENLHNIWREAQILMKLKDEHIISLEDIYVSNDGHQIFFVMELCEGGDLFDRIKNRTRPLSRYDEMDARGVTRNIALGIRYLHSKGVAHRDIKPENILMTSNSNDVDIKITDFGLAKRFDVAAGTKTVCGTPQYFAPEVLSRMGTVAGHGSYSIEADMWSLGVVVYVLLSGNFPFQSNEMMAMSVARARYHFHGEEWRPVSDLAKDFIRKLLVVNPQQRMTAVEALEHPWLNDNVYNGIVGVQAVQSMPQTYSNTHHHGNSNANANGASVSDNNGDCGDSSATAPNKMGKALQYLQEQEVFTEITNNANNGGSGEHLSMSQGANTPGNMIASSSISPDLATSYSQGASGAMVSMPPTEDLVPPKCDCGQESKRFVTRKEGRNHGRVFYRCRRPKANQCRYFQWQDELQPDFSLMEVGTAKMNHMHAPPLPSRAHRSQPTPSSQTPPINTSNNQHNAHTSTTTDAITRISGRSSSRREAKSVIELCEYGRGLALFGETRAVKDHIKAEYNGKFSQYLMHPINKVGQPGWVIAKDKYTAVMADLHMRVYLVNTTASADCKDTSADNSTTTSNSHIGKDKEAKKEGVSSSQSSQRSITTSDEVTTGTTGTTAEDVASSGNCSPKSTAMDVATSVATSMDVGDVEEEQEMTQPLVREQSSILDTCLSSPVPVDSTTTHSGAVVDLVDDEEEETAPLLSPGGICTPRGASPPTRKSARKKPNSAVKSGPINQYLVNKSMASSVRVVAGSGETTFTAGGARGHNSHHNKNGKETKKPLRRGVLVTSNQSSAKKNKNMSSRTKTSGGNLLRILTTGNGNKNSKDTTHANKSNMTNGSTTQKSESVEEKTSELANKRSLTRTASGSAGSRSAKKSRK